MHPVVITAFTMTNGCGTGCHDVLGALRDGRTGLRRNDFEPARELVTYIGRVDGVESIAWPRRFADYDCRNHRLALLALEHDGFAEAITAAVRRHGPQRIGVFVGTSTSGILATELHVRAATRDPGMPRISRDRYYRSHSMFAPARFLREACGLRGVAVTVSTACSSSAKVFGAAARAMSSGFCDAAIVGGIDSLALSTLHGFNALELLSSAPCRPFDDERDGISIGEGAGFALLERDGDADVALVGVGESVDAWHMSSPHPQGVGAVRAMRAALVSARLDASDVDYINLHGTATRGNDVVEDLAVHDVFGARPSASSTKGWTGHTLGAAGITEALISICALREQWIPGTLNCRTPDPSLRSRIETQSRRATLRHALSNSFGFGGNNCSLLFGLRR